MMRIEFDAAKRDATLKQRGLDMARAEDVFAAHHRTIVDDRRDYGEIRYITVGYLDGRMIVMVWTWRGEAVRVISLRKANDREQAQFDFGP